MQEKHRECDKTAMAVKIQDEIHHHFKIVKKREVKRDWEKDTTLKQKHKRTLYNT